MTINDLISFLSTSIPYLNPGMIILVVDLALKKVGFEITPKEFKRKPWKNLILGLGLVLTSSFLSFLV